MDIALILSVLLLLAAPLLARVVGARPNLKSMLDGFVLVTVLGLVMLTLLPEAIAHAGVWGVLLGVLGFALPWLAELVFHRSEEMTHRIVMLVACLALILHAGSDGAILAFAHTHQNGEFITTGILLHRLGTALAVWWLLRPVLSAPSGMLVLAALGVMTVIGYFITTLAGDWYQMPLIGYWQAFACGSLLHVLLHPLEDHNPEPPQPTLKAHRLGTVFGILFVAALIASHYLQHTPGTISIMPGHSDTYMMDMLYVVGRLIAPLLCLVVILSAVFGQLTIKKQTARPFDGALKGLEKSVPWSLAFWLGVSMLATIYPDLLPSTDHGTVLFALWGGLVIALLVHMGARAFLSVLMPQALAHYHS